MVGMEIHNLHSESFLSCDQSGKFLHYPRVYRLRQRRLCASGAWCLWQQASCIGGWRLGPVARQDAQR